MLGCAGQTGGKLLTSRLHYQTFVTFGEKGAVSESPCRWTRSSGSTSAAIRPSRCCWRRRSAATPSPITRRTGWRCAPRGCSRPCSTCRCATKSAIISPSASRGASTSRDLDVDPAAPGPAVRSRLHHDHASARAHPSEDAGGQRPARSAQRAGEDVRDAVSGPDAADADHPRPRRDQGVPRRARRHRDEAALRQGRRGGVSARAARTSTSARSTICSP